MPCTPPSDRGRRRPTAIAVSGMTVTTTPAAAGDIPHPSTRRSTTRKSAATRPPATRSSAAFAVIDGLPAGAGTGRAPTPRAASNNTSASGTCARKIDSHPSSCVRIPPAAGPSAAPSTPAATQVRSAASSLPSACERRSSAAVTSSAAPSAWTHRAPTSTSNEGASPHASDATAKTTTPTMNASRGRLLETYAAGTATTASTRLNDVSTHATDVMATSNWPRISGRASVTIEESASARPTATPSSLARIARV